MTLSFIVRASLLKILADGLLKHFTDAAAAETLIANQGLTDSVLRRATRQKTIP